MTILPTTLAALSTVAILSYAFQRTLKQTFSKRTQTEFFIDTRTVPSERVLDAVSWITDNLECAYTIKTYECTPEEKEAHTFEYDKWKLLLDLRKKAYGDAAYSPPHWIDPPKLKGGYAVVVNDDSEALKLKLMFSDVLQVAQASGEQQ